MQNINNYSLYRQAMVKKADALQMSTDEFGIPEYTQDTYPDLGDSEGFYGITPGRGLATLGAVAGTGAAGATLRNMESGVRNEDTRRRNLRNAQAARHAYHTGRADKYQGHADRYAAGTSTNKRFNTIANNARATAKNYTKTTEAEPSGWRKFLGYPGAMIRGMLGVRNPGVGKPGLKNQTIRRGMMTGLRESMPTFFGAGQAVANGARRAVNAGRTFASSLRHRKKSTH